MNDEHAEQLDQLRQAEAARAERDDNLIRHYQQQLAALTQAHQQAVDKCDEYKAGHDLHVNLLSRMTELHRINFDHEAGFHAAEFHIKQLEQELADVKTGERHLLGWTTQKPTIPGYYWFRGIGRENQIMWIYEQGTAFVMSGTNQTVENIDGDWAGPLAPPMEPPQ